MTSSRRLPTTVLEVRSSWQSATLPNLACVCALHSHPILLRFSSEMSLKLAPEHCGRIRLFEKLLFAPFRNSYAQGAALTSKKEDNFTVFYGRLGSQHKEKWSRHHQTWQRCVPVYWLSCSVEIASKRTLHAPSARVVCDHRNTVLCFPAKTFSPHSTNASETHCCQIKST